MSDEVNYSRFYYKGRPEETRPSPPDDDPRTHRVDYDEPKRNREKRKNGVGKKFFFGAFVILVCFGLVFVFADFFGKGFLTDAVSKAFSGETYEYFFVATPASSRYVAYADSIAVKQKGGGGYIIEEDERRVAYAVYTDGATASSVSLKNSSTEIYTVKYSSKDKLAHSIDDLVISLEKAVFDWEKGNVTEAELTTILQSEKETFGTLKQEYSDNKIGLIDLVIDGLGSFSPSATEKITQLSRLRYFTCCVVYSAYSIYKK